MLSLPLTNFQGVCLSIKAWILYVSLWLCVKERSVFSKAPLENNKHFKGSLRDAEHDICPKTRGLSTDPPLFSLRLARRQSKMSFSLTPFWWICSTVCLPKSTTEDLANEPWALWIKQQGRREVVRENSHSLWAFEKQNSTEGNVTGAVSGSRQSPAHEKKPIWLHSDGLFTFVRCINTQRPVRFLPHCTDVGKDKLLPCCILFYLDRF